MYASESDFCYLPSYRLLTCRGNLPSSSSAFFWPFVNGIQRCFYPRMLDWDWFVQLFMAHTSWKEDRERHSSIGERKRFLLSFIPTEKRLRERKNLEQKSKKNEITVTAGFHSRQFHQMRLISHVGEPYSINIYIYRYIRLFFSSFRDKPIRKMGATTTRSTF